MAKRPRGRTGKARAREERAWELSTKGFSTRQIAKKLDLEGLGPISHVSVSKALRRVEADIAPGIEARAVYMRAFQLQALENIFRESMQAWYKSKKGEQEIKERKHSPAPVPPPRIAIAGQVATPPSPPVRVPFDHVITSLKQTCGESAHLKRALDALADLRDLLGMNAPTRTEFITPGPMGDNVVIYIPDNGRDPGIVEPGDDPRTLGVLGLEGPA